MNKHRLNAFLCVGLILSSLGLASNIDAQVKGVRGAARRLSTADTKKAPPASKISGLSALLLARETAAPSATDPCLATTPLTLGQPIDGTLATGDCVLTDGTRIDFYEFKGFAGQAVSFSENSAAFDSYMYLFDDKANRLDENDDSVMGTTNSRIPAPTGIMTLPYTGSYVIGATSFSVATGAYTLRADPDAACVPVPVFYNQTVNGDLAASDCSVNLGGALYYTDLYTFYGVAGKQISLKLASTAVDSFLILHTPTGPGSIADDDSGGGSTLNDARIPVTGTFTLPETGTYTIEASSFNSTEIGSYTLSFVGPTTGSISGRVVTPAGAGLRNATVSITIAGVPVRVTTSAFGFYTFSNIPTNATYVITVPSRLFRFSPRTVIFNDDLTNVDFTGLE